MKLLRDKAEFPILEFLRAQSSQAVPVKNIERHIAEEFGYEWFNLENQRMIKWEVSFSLSRLAALHMIQARLEDGYIRITDKGRLVSLDRLTRLNQDFEKSNRY